MGEVPHRERPRDQRVDRQPARMHIDRYLADLEETKRGSHAAGAAQGTCQRPSRSWWYLRPMSDTMFEKIWSRHVVAEGPAARTLLYVDRHLLHEGATARFRAPRAQAGARSAARTPSSPPPTTTCPPTGARDRRSRDPEVRGMVEALGAPHRATRHRLLRPRRRAAGDRARHRPRAGLDPAGHHARVRRLATPPPTARFGALAFGIGSTEVEHVLATQMPLAAEAARDAHHAWTARWPPGVARQGRDPRHHRADRRRRRRRPRDRVRGPAIRAHVHGRAA